MLLNGNLAVVFWGLLEERRLVRVHISQLGHVLLLSNGSFNDDRWVHRPS